MAKNMKKTSEASRKRRQRRVRMTVRGTAARPRLSVFRSAKHIYAQIIDDESGKTLAAAGDSSKKGVGKADEADDKTTMKAKVASAFAVGKMIAEAGKKKGVDAVVFDRNGFAYTGRVAALADGARSGGLKF